MLIAPTTITFVLLISSSLASFVPIIPSPYPSYLRMVELVDGGIKKLVPLMLCNFMPHSIEKSILIDLSYILMILNDDYIHLYVYSPINFTSIHLYSLQC